MSDIQLNDPQTLYHRWDDSQWSPFDVELSTDREQWPQLDPSLREIIYFALSSLMVAEERITTKFAGHVAVHAPEEETTFLATQQVDEARHMQFYARFRDEVCANERGTVASYRVYRAAPESGLAGVRLLVTGDERMDSFERAMTTARQWLLMRGPRYADDD